MNWKVFAVAIMGLLLKNRLPYAASVSIVVVLLLIGNEIVRMIKLRLHFNHMVILDLEEC
jgi:hypothetical protein